MASSIKPAASTVSLETWTRRTWAGMGAQAVLPEFALVGARRRWFSACRCSLNEIHFPPPSAAQHQPGAVSERRLSAPAAPDLSSKPGIHSRTVKPAFQGFSYSFHLLRIDISWLSIGCGGDCWGRRRSALRSAGAKTVPCLPGLKGSCRWSPLSS
jgi:hypothetical protein